MITLDPPRSSTLKTPALIAETEVNPLLKAVAASWRLFAYAILFSTAMAVLTLTTSFYMLEVYDRVLTSRSEETLVLLTVIAIAAINVRGAGLAPLAAFRACEHAYDRKCCAASSARNALDFFPQRRSRAAAGPARSRNDPCLRCEPDSRAALRLSFPYLLSRHHALFALDLFFHRLLRRHPACADRRN